jgi:outer membrane lipoprotein carrier protein
MRALLILTTSAALAVAPLAAQSATAAPARTSASPSVTATLDRAVAAYEKVRTLRATFRQTLTNPIMGRTTVSTGEVVQERPQYIAIRFTDPAGDRIVADGKSVWIYLPSSTPGQVIRSRLGADGAGVPDVTAQFLTAPREKYTVADGGRDEVGGRPARVLRLAARDRTLPFERATVWVDDADGLVRQFETVDGSGVTRRVTITRLTTNAPVDRAAFRFAPPKGVKVFDQP